MKRWNLREAFIGEPSLEREGTRRLRDGHDAVELAVRGGKVTLVVPASTPDREVFRPSSFAQASTWELELEDGWILHFQLPEDAIGASAQLTRKTNAATSASCDRRD
jgi:hypothetical protein